LAHGQDSLLQAQPAVKELCRRENISASIFIIA
jgi:hypothetical protein